MNLQVSESPQRGLACWQASEPRRKNRVILSLRISLVFFDIVIDHLPRWYISSTTLLHYFVYLPCVEIVVVVASCVA